MLLLYVQSPRGVVISFPVSIHDTIEDVKIRIQNTEGVSAEKQKLFWGTCELLNFRTIATCLIVVGAKFLNGGVRMELEKS